MEIIITILLAILAASNLAIVWLLWRMLPDEKQKEILRKIEKPKAEVAEWTPPQDEEQRVFDETLEKIRQ